MPQDGYSTITMPTESAESLREIKERSGLQWDAFASRVVDAYDESDDGFDPTPAGSVTVDIAGRDEFVERVAAELAEQVSLEVTVEPGEAMMSDLDAAVRAAARDGFREAVEAAKGGRL